MRAALLLSLVCLGWGTIPLVAAEAELPAAALTFARVWTAAGGLALLVAATRPAGPRLMSVAPGRAVLTGVVLAAHWTAMFAAYERAPDSAVIFLVFLAPVGVAVIERPSSRLVGALVVGVIGLALVAGPTVGDADGSTTIGLALALVSGGLFVALLLLAKPLSELYGGVRLTLLEMVVAGVALTPAAAMSSWDGIGRAWPWLVLLGLVHTAIGTAIYLRTLALVPATEVGILGYLEPVGVVLFAWVLVGDRPTGATIIGGAIVVVAGALAATSSSHVDRPEVSTSVPR